jgi:hypothetical protein
MSETQTAPAGTPDNTAVQETPAQAAERNSIVGHRNLSSHENAALLARLEKNGTTLEQVNEITRKHGIEIAEDNRTDYERSHDERYPAGATPQEYNINLVPGLPVNALGDPKAIAELTQHANAFSHALEIPKEQAGELFRDILRASNKLAAMEPAEADAHNIRQAALLARALGGVEKLEAAAQMVGKFLERANNPALVAAMAPAFNDSLIFMRLLHHVQLLQQRAARAAKGGV